MKGVEFDAKVAADVEEAKAIAETLLIALWSICDGYVISLCAIHMWRLVYEKTNKDFLERKIPFYVHMQETGRDSEMLAFKRTASGSAARN